MKAQGADVLAGGPITKVLDVYNKEGAEAFWKNLREKVDPYSARQYLANE